MKHKYSVNNQVWPTWKLYATKACIYDVLVIFPLIAQLEWPWVHSKSAGVQIKRWWMLRRKTNVLYSLVVSTGQLWNILSKSKCRSNELRGCTRPAVHQGVHDTWTWWRVWRNIRAGRVRARSDYTAADPPPQKPRDKPAPRPAPVLESIHPLSDW